LVVLLDPALACTPELFWLINWTGICGAAVTRSDDVSDPGWIRPLEFVPLKLSVYAPGGVNVELVVTVKVPPRPEFIGCGLKTGFVPDGNPRTLKVMGVDALPGGGFGRSTKQVAVAPERTIWGLIPPG
jgi:hypothetical protein